MFKKILLGLFLVSMALPSNVFAGRGGAAFGGAFAGSMVGGLMTGAMQKSDKVVVVQQQPQRTETQAQMEARIRNEVALENKIKELDRRLQEKRELEKSAPKRPQIGQPSKREIRNRMKDLEQEIQIMKRQLDETKK